MDDVHPDHGNTLGSTALHNTARQGDMAGVTLLLEHGANVGLKNELGETPMDVAKNKEGRQRWPCLSSVPCSFLFVNSSMWMCVSVPSEWGRR